MVIASSAATRKGQITVATVAEIDALISQLIIAKTGIIGAQSAIGARGAMDAASEVEASRQAAIDGDTPAAGPETVPAPTGLCGHLVTPGAWSQGYSVCRDCVLGDAGKAMYDRASAGEQLPQAAVAVPATEMVPLDESLPWSRSHQERCGWLSPDGDHCQLQPHGPKVMHAAPIGAVSMRRWAALRSVTA
jgi:hypothetical protein